MNVYLTAFLSLYVFLGWLGLLRRVQYFLERRCRSAPFDLSRTQIRDEFRNVVDFNANLFARVSLAYGYGSVFWSGRVSDGSVVDGDGERDAEFIRSAVSFADGDGGGV